VPERQHEGSRCSLANKKRILFGNAWKEKNESISFLFSSGVFIERVRKPA